MREFENNNKSINLKNLRNFININIMGLVKLLILYFFEIKIKSD